LSTVLASKLPLFIGVVIGLSYLLLAIAFRGLLIPLKAAVTNLLSVGAVFGVLVAVLQWESLAGVRDPGGSGPDLPASVPVRHPPRAVDGLRGLAAHLHPPGIPPHRRQLWRCGSAILTAILLDAVIVRSALVPALMQTSGKANW
jgi:uncharacterized membrane protein YdfJ with MMPL/SSD domain